MVVAVLLDPRADHGADLLAPFAAVEDTVMADLRGHVVFLLAVGQVGGDIEGGFGLAEAGDIVELTFDGEDGGLGDGIRADAVVVMVELAIRQAMFVEDFLDGL